MVTRGNNLNLLFGDKPLVFFCSSSCWKVRVFDGTREAMDLSSSRRRWTSHCPADCRFLGRGGNTLLSNPRYQSARMEEKGEEDVPLLVDESVLTPRGGKPKQKQEKPLKM